MDFTAEGILERMKEDLKNPDTRIEGSFTMDNLQAVSEELARFNFMRLVPLEEQLNTQQEEMATSGNERHYIKWAKEATKETGEKVAGNARVSSPRDGTGNVFVAIVSTTASAPTDEDVRIVQEYINTKRPVGANPTVSAAEGIPVAIVCTIQAKAGYTMETIKRQIQTDIQSYLLEIAFQSSAMVLNYYRISNIISDVEGVLDLIDLTINGGKDSITADYNKFFDLGDVVVSVK